MTKIGAMASTVNVYELLGAEVFLYFTLGGTQITARVNPHTTAKSRQPDQIQLRYGQDSLL